jgi:hypothetical protein
MNIDEMINFISHNVVNLNLGDKYKKYFVVTDSNFKNFYGACLEGKHYQVIEMKGDWLLSKCLDGCGKCKACIDGVFVEKSSGFIEFEERI